MRIKARYYLGGGSGDVFFRQLAGSDRLQMYHPTDGWLDAGSRSMERLLTEIAPEKAMYALMRLLGLTATQAAKAVETP